MDGSSPPLFCSANPTFDLVDSQEVDILPLPRVHSGFVIVHKNKKVSKGSVRGIKDSIQDKAIIPSYIDSPPSCFLSPNLPLSPRALRACTTPANGF